LKKLTNQQARQLALTLKEGTRRHGGETPPTHKKSATPSSPSITPSRMRTKPISWLAGELQPYKQMSKTPYFRRWRTFTDCSAGLSLNTTSSKLQTPTCRKVNILEIIIKEKNDQT
jgi:hypothetical protein